MTQNDIVVLAIFVGSRCFFWGFVAGYIAKDWGNEPDGVDALGGVLMMYLIVWLPLTIGFVAGLWHLLTN